MPTQYSRVLDECVLPTLLPDGAYSFLVSEFAVELKIGGISILPLRVFVANLLVGEVY